MRELYMLNTCNSESLLNEIDSAPLSTKLKIIQVLTRNSIKTDYPLPLTALDGVTDPLKALMKGDKGKGKQYSDQLTEVEQALYGDMNKLLNLGFEGIHELAVNFDPETLQSPEYFTRLAGKNELYIGSDSLTALSRDSFSNLVVEKVATFLAMYEDAQLTVEFDFELEMGSDAKAKYVFRREGEHLMVDDYGVYAKFPTSFKLTDKEGISNLMYWLKYILNTK